jgi:hypothetical protein
MVLLLLIYAILLWVISEEGIVSIPKRCEGSCVGFQWEDHLRSPMKPAISMVFVVGSVLVYIIVRCHPLKPPALSAIFETVLATFALCHFRLLFRSGMQDVDSDSIRSILDQIKSKFAQFWRFVSLNNHPLPALPQPPPSRTVSFLVNCSFSAMFWFGATHTAYFRTSPM